MMVEVSTLLWPAHPVPEQRHVTAVLACIELFAMLCKYYINY